MADNTGVNATELVHKLYLAHKEKGKNYGFNIDAEQADVIDVTTTKIYDLYASKWWGLKYATSAASTILKVDQIIMAKRAGGPKARQPAGSDDES